MESIIRPFLPPLSTWDKRHVPSSAVGKPPGARQKQRVISQLQNLAWPSPELKSSPGHTLFYFVFHVVRSNVLLVLALTLPGTSRLTRQLRGNTSSLRSRHHARITSKHLPLHRQRCPKPDSTFVIQENDHPLNLRVKLTLILFLELDWC